MGGRGMAMKQGSVEGMDQPLDVKTTEDEHRKANIGAKAAKERERAARARANVAKLKGRIEKLEDKARRHDSKAAQLETQLG